MVKVFFKFTYGKPDPHFLQNAFAMLRVGWRKVSTSPCPVCQVTASGAANRFDACADPVILRH